MKLLKNIIAVLVLLSGIGHILLAVAFDNEAMFMQMIGGGVFYLILSALIWKNNKIAMGGAGLLMLVATIGASMNLQAFGYPIGLMKAFLGLNLVVVVLNMVYFHNLRHGKKSITIE